MIDDGRRKDAKNDWHWLLEARSKDEGEELCLIADFSEGDDSGGDEEGFHKNSQAGLQTIDHDASPAMYGGVVVKGLAKLGNRLRHDLLVKCVDVSLFDAKSGYSPMTVQL